MIAIYHIHRCAEFWENPMVNFVYIYANLIANHFYVHQVDVFYSHAFLIQLATFLFRNITL